MTISRTLFQDMHCSSYIGGALALHLQSMNEEEQRTNNFS